MATVDAYGEYEQTSGWFCCLEEVFENVEFVKVFGEKVKLKRLELEETEILAVCEKSGEEAEVALHSIHFLNLSKTQKLWLRAWLNWK